MALWPAGSKFTSGKLEAVSAITSLTDVTSTAVADYQWGSEYVAFDNPGVECVVSAILTGRTLGMASGGGTAAANTVNVWLQISFDGGATWNSSAQLSINDQPISTTYRTPLTVVHRAQAVPSGQIRVRAMWHAVAGSGQRVSQGQILANLTGA